MNERTIEEIKNQYLIKQIYKPDKDLYVVLTDTDENGKVEHLVLEVDYLAVCFDGGIRPVVLRDGDYEVFADREDYDGFYTRKDLDRMRRKCEDEFLFY